jgi:hypothetical protein
MTRAISTINQFDFTKTQINNFVEKVIMEIDNENPLDILPKLKVMEEIVKQLKAKINHNVLMEASNCPEKTFSINGCSFTKVFRKSYDYSNCEKHEKIKGELKELEKLMQTITKPIADPETGELIEPAIVRGSESISITLPK